ncbi:type VII secretion target [Nocardia sp. NBC_00403]|uniref:type VII secretion target n=1 Tax=Nocardia sp. NBC_00403 TaxID=2975990 RepID=UPI002E1AAEED
MTSPADAISIDPDEVRSHAEKVKTLLESMTSALEAASYIGAADDGFGSIPRPFVKMVIDDNQQGAVEAIRKLAGEVAELPDKLATVASTVEDYDKAFKRDLDELRATIGEKGGK